MLKVLKNQNCRLQDFRKPRTSGSENKKNIPTLVTTTEG